MDTNFGNFKLQNSNTKLIFDALWNLKEILLHLVLHWIVTLRVHPAQRTRDSLETSFSFHNKGDFKRPKRSPALEHTEFLLHETSRTADIQMRQYQCDLMEDAHSREPANSRALGKQKCQVSSPRNKKRGGRHARINENRIIGPQGMPCWTRASGNWWGASQVSLRVESSDTGEKESHFQSPAAPTNSSPLKVGILLDLLIKLAVDLSTESSSKLVWLSAPYWTRNIKQNPVAKWYRWTVRSKILNYSELLEETLSAALDGTVQPRNEYLPWSSSTAPVSSLTALPGGPSIPITQNLRIF